MGWENDFQTIIVLPTGATSGQRIVIDGTTGIISIYNSDGDLVDTIGGPDGDITSISSSGQSSVVQLHNGGIIFAASTDPADLADGGLIQAIISNFPITQETLTLTTPQGAIFDDPLVVVFAGGEGGQASGSISAPQMKLTDLLGTSVADMPLSGAAYKTDLTGVSLDWQTPSYAANWAGSTVMGTLTGLQTLRYRIDAEDNLWLVGAFAAGATLPGAAVFTLPAAYRPKQAYGFPVAKNAAGTVTSTWMYVSTAGNLNINSQFGSSVTASATYYINHKIPMGNLT